MKNIIFYICLICGANSAMAQKITVKDLTSLQVIPGVTVLIEGQENKFKTNELGQVELISVQAKSKITFKHQWYQPQTLTLDELKTLGGEVYLQEKVQTYDEMVISAGKFVEPASVVSQAVEVIRTTDLEQMNQNSMADVLSNTGKVMVQKSQLGGGSPIIRGFETNKVLMVIDGVRMNNAIYRGGHLQNVVTLDNAIMDKVEIVFGPGSTVYGSDALGGVMHFYTKNPILSTQDKTHVKAGAYTRYMSASSSYSGHASVSVGGKKWASLTAFTYNNFGDLRQGTQRNPFYGDFGKRDFYVTNVNGVDSVHVNSDPNLQVGSGYQQYDILQKILFKPNENQQHILNIQYSTSSDVPRYDRLTLVKNGLPRYGDWFYGPQKRLLASYAIDFTKPNKMYDEGKLIVAYQQIEESRNSRSFQSLDLASRIEEVQIYSFNADFGKKLGKHEVRYGAEFYYNDVQSKALLKQIVTGAESSLDTRYPDGGSSMLGSAVYVTHSWKINKKLRLNDGLRMNYTQLNARFVDKTFFPFPFDEIKQPNQSLNGNVGLIYRPNDNWRISGLFSTGFRSPNVDDLSKVFESVPGRVIVPNPNLKPEYTYNYELGISKSFKHGIDASVIGYYTNYRDAITTIPGQFNGSDSILYEGVMSRVITSSNAAKAYLCGIEASLKAELNPYFSLTSSITYTYARIETDSVAYPLDHIPPVFGRTGIQLRVKKFKGEFFSLYSGWKRLADYNLVSGEDNLPFATVHGMPAWFTLNLRLAYQLSKKLNLQVACENLLDQNYRVFSSNISAPGRNFIVTLRGNF